MEKQTLEQPKVSVPETVKQELKPFEAVPERAFTPQEQADLITKDIEGKASEINSLQYKTEETMKAYRAVRQKLGLPLEGMDPVSVVEQREKIEKLRNEEHDLEEQRIAIIGGTEGVSGGGGGKGFSVELFEKGYHTEPIVKKVLALSEKERTVLKKTGYMLDGTTLHVPPVQPFEPEEAKSIVKMIEAGIYPKWITTEKTRVEHNYEDQSGENYTEAPRPSVEAPVPTPKPEVTIGYEGERHNPESLLNTLEGQQDNIVKEFGNAQTNLSNGEMPGGFSAN